MNPDESPSPDPDPTSPDPDPIAAAEIEAEPPTRLSRRDFVFGAAAGVGAASGTVAAVPAATSPARAQEGTTTTVDMTDQLVFDPDEIAVTPGTTVVWENVGTVGHSVTAYEGEIPEDATYFASGGFETEDAARSAYSAGDPESGDVPGGETYEHTFEVEGTYEYFCIPHEGVGMIGTVEVSEDAGAPQETSGRIIPQVSDTARTIGIAASIALVATVGFAYVFLKYGGDYEREEGS